VVLSTTQKLALSLIASIAVTAAFGVAQTPPAAPAADAKPQKVAKDQAEADLINSTLKDPDPAKRLKELDKWTHDYPETAFATERQQAYLVTYSQLSNCKEASRVAREILKTTPTHDLSLRVIVGCIYQIKPPEPVDLDAAEKAATYLIEHPTKAADNAMAAKDWDGFILLCKNTIPFIDLQRKDMAKAEADLNKLLQSDPSDSQASYTLAGILFEQRAQKPANQPPAIFEYARAGVYDGPEAVADAVRKDSMTRATRYYKAYHGTDEGFDKVLALAKTNALPPADFNIKSTADLAKEKAEAEAAADAADPVFATWKTIKAGLTGDGDAAYFDANVKDAELPPGGQKFKGTIVSMKPTINPKTLVMNYKDAAGDITLVLDTPLRGKMDIGSELQFEGQASAYMKAPFMLTLKIGEGENKDKIIGWKPVAPAPVRKKQP
jgi:hypothetical protein